MFGSGSSNGNGSTRSTSPAGAARGKSAFSVVGPEMTITGNVQTDGDVHVDGRIEGDLTCATLVQGAGGRIAGQVTADVARLAGTIEGSVRARDLVVERGARVLGDVEYETITVEQGGQVEGRMRHLGSVALTAVQGGVVTATLTGPAGNEEPQLKVV